MSYSSSSNSCDLSSKSQHLSDSFLGEIGLAQGYSKQGVKDSCTPANLAFRNDEAKESYAANTSLALSTSYIDAAASAVATENRERKRKQSMQTGNAERELQKQQERLAANRRSAALSRQRRKDLIKQLQLTVMDLTKRNVELQNRCERLERQLSTYQNAMLQQTQAEAANISNINIGSFSNGSLINPSIILPWNSSYLLPTRAIIPTQGVISGTSNYATARTADLFHLNQQPSHQLQQNLHQLADLLLTRNNQGDNDTARRTDNERYSGKDQVSVLWLSYHPSRNVA